MDPLLASSSMLVVRHLETQMGPKIQETCGFNLANQPLLLET